MAGRPKRQFSDEEIQQIEQYALDGCYAETIARALGIAVNTLKRNFGRKMRRLRALGKLQLKHHQREQAKNNSQMAIWLGKQDLGQVDKQEIKQTGQIVQPQTEAEKAALEASARVYKVRLARGE